MPTYRKVNQGAITVEDDVGESIRTMQQIESTSSLTDKLLVEAEFKKRHRKGVNFKLQLDQMSTPNQHYHHIVKNIPMMIAAGMTDHYIVTSVLEEIRGTFNAPGHPCFADAVKSAPSSWVHDIPIMLSRPNGQSNDLHLTERLAMHLFYVMRNQFVFVHANNSTDKFKNFVGKQVRSEVRNEITAHKGAIPRHLDMDSTLTEHQRHLWNVFYNKQSSDALTEFVNNITTHRTNAILSDLRIPFATEDVKKHKFSAELNKLMFTEFVNYMASNTLEKWPDVNIHYDISLTKAELEQLEHEYGPGTWLWLAS